MDKIGVGQSVKHPVFGVGTVRATQGDKSCVLFPTRVSVIAHTFITVCEPTDESSALDNAIPAFKPKSKSAVLSLTDHKVYLDQCLEQEKDKQRCAALFTRYLPYEELIVRNPDAARGQEFDETKSPELTKLLDDLCVNCGIMLIGCNPSYEQEAIRFLTSNGVAHLQKYLRIGKTAEELGAEAHGMWVNIFIPDPNVPDIDVELGVYFNPHRIMSKRYHGLYQLSKLSYTHRLLGMVAMEEEDDPDPDDNDALIGEK
jgi:hypothetical protein